MNNNQNGNGDIFNERYLRQIRISGWNQKKIGKSAALIAGVGGLGSVTATYLTAAGIGRLVLCDPGVIERSNLNRQVLYTEVSIGVKKVEAARARLKAMNPEVEIEIFSELLEKNNIQKIAARCDIIIDGLDNQVGKKLLNKFAARKKLPFIYGAACSWDGIVGTFLQPETACLECVKSPRKSFMDSHSGSIIGITSALIGAIQSSEALKLIMGSKSCLMGKLLIVDAKCMKFDTINLEKSGDCPVCSKRK